MRERRTSARMYIKTRVEFWRLNIKNVYSLLFFFLSFLFDIAIWNFGNYNYETTENVNGARHRSLIRDLGKILQQLRRVKYLFAQWRIKAEAQTEKGRCDCAPTFCILYSDVQSVNWPFYISKLTQSLMRRGVNFDFNCRSIIITFVNKCLY